MFSNEDLEGDTVLDKIGNNTSMVKYIELYRFTPREYYCIMILTITMK